jgi:FkbM family methyltransferase
MKKLNYFIGSTLNLIIRLLPLHLRYRLSGVILTQDMQWSMYNLRLNGFRPQRVIDVGAYKGEWASICKGIFPSAAIMLIEPQVSGKKFLERFCQKHPGCLFINALVGASEGRVVHFLLSGDISRVLLESEAKTDNCLELPMHTLDCLTKETPFGKSELLKLDVQGYELEVLKGASSILNDVEVIIMEISLIQLIPKAPLFHEVISGMHDKGFRLYDICGKFRRPIDRAPWQIDAVFVRSNSSLGSVLKGWGSP